MFIFAFWTYIILDVSIQELIDFGISKSDLQFCNWCLKLFMHLIFRYYFDGSGKFVRPCIAMCVGHMANHHHDQLASQDEDKCSKQRNIAMVSEMIHTASLVHDDILDHAETRRGKESVNVRWDIKRS